MPNRPTTRPQALVFDVFGTVVDWHGSVAREVLRHGLPVDAEDFARAWRAGYAPAMDEVRRGALPWTNIDGLHRRILDHLLAERGLEMPEAVRADLNLAWHRLDPWPEVPAGLARLKAAMPLATLSNGNLRLLLDLSRHGGLAWDALFSAELFGHYKPDPEVYLGACRLLDLPPAASRNRRPPARMQDPGKQGLVGAGRGVAPYAEDEFDVVVKGFDALAAHWGA